MNPVSLVKSMRFGSASELRRGTSPVGICGTVEGQGHLQGKPFSGRQTELGRGSQYETVSTISYLNGTQPYVGGGEGVPRRSDEHYSAPLNEAKCANAVIEACG